MPLTIVLIADVDAIVKKILQPRFDNVTLAPPAPTTIIASDVAMIAVRHRLGKLIPIDQMHIFDTIRESYAVEDQEEWSVEFADLPHGLISDGFHLSSSRPSSASSSSSERERGGAVAQGDFNMGLELRQEFSEIPISEYVQDLYVDLCLPLTLHSLIFWIGISWMPHAAPLLRQVKDLTLTHCTPGYDVQGHVLLVLMSMLIGENFRHSI